MTGDDATGDSLTGAESANISISTGAVDLTGDSTTDLTGDLTGDGLSGAKSANISISTEAVDLTGDSTVNLTGGDWPGGDLTEDSTGGLTGGDWTGVSAKGSVEKGSEENKLTVEM